MAREACVAWARVGWACTGAGRPRVIPRSPLPTIRVGARVASATTYGLPDWLVTTAGRGRGAGVATGTAMVDGGVVVTPVGGSWPGGRTT